MTFEQAMNDTRPVKDVPTGELKQQLELFTRYKTWGLARFFTVREEVQHRATWAWVKQDVFGDTFVA